MTRTTCLCRLSFEPLLPLEREWETELLCPSAKTDFGLVVETESLVQPKDITQVLWVVDQLSLVRQARLKGRVVLFTDIDQNEINQVILCCAEKKAAAVLIARQQDQTLTEAAVPVFTLESEILSQVAMISGKGGNQWMVSIEVLCPLPDHATADSACSSIMDESKVEGKTSHGTDNGDISWLDHAVRAQKASERLKATDELRTSWCERRKNASVILVALCTSLAFHGVATILFRTFDKWGTQILQNGINLELGDTKRAPWHNWSWTLESLYPSVRCDDNTTSCPQLNASVEQEMDLRRWLNDHDLPQDVGDKLLYAGVRKIDDLFLLFQSSTDNGTFNEIAALDVVKMKQALGMSNAHAPPLDSGAIDSKVKEGFIKIKTIIGQILSGFVTGLGPLLDLLCVGMVVHAVLAVSRQRVHSAKAFYGIFLLLSAIRSIWFTTFNSMSMLTVIKSMTNDSGTCDQHVLVCFLTQLVTTSGSLVLLGIFVAISANA